MNMPIKPPAGGNGGPAAAGVRRARRRAGRSILQALDEVQALLTDRPRRRDLLIEHLHLIQDKYGHLSAAHLTALAAEMKMALTEVYEVATFYAHFDVVKEGPPPPPVTVRVCNSLSCAMAGADRLLRKPASSAPRCALCARRAWALATARRWSPSITVQTFHATPEKIAAAVKKNEHPHAWHSHKDARRLSQEGGYSLLKACTSGKRTRDDIIKIVSDAGLRGLGGAGFPTGRKWSLVRAEPAPRLFAVNCDEGEPGTFKDRYLSRARSAPLPRRHADRRLGGRGAGHLHLHPRRISRTAADAARRDPQGRGGGAFARTPRFTFAAAPAPTSAAKNPR